MDDFDQILEGAGHSRDLLVGALSRFGKEHVPSNIRLLASTLLGDRTPVDESYFPEEDLQAMREAALGTRQYYEGEDARLREEVDTWKDIAPDKVIYRPYVQNPDRKPGEPMFVEDPSQRVTAGQVLERANAEYANFQASRPKRDTIQYEGYGGNYSEDEGWLSTLQQSFTDPHVRASTSIGRAVLDVDEAGNTILKDTYDWGAGKTARDLSPMAKLGLLMDNVGRPAGLGNILGNIMLSDDDAAPREVRLNLGKVLPPKEAKK
jgi:hypothetical protein